MKAKSSARDELVTARGLYHYAGSYHGSALALLSTGVKVSHPEAPVSFLFYHAIELYLKSYLRQEGASVADLAGKNLGHDLKRLGNEAKSRGLNLDQTSDVFLIDWVINDDAMRSRYISNGIIKSVPVNILIETSASLRDSIGKHLLVKGVIPVRSMIPFTKTA